MPLCTIAAKTASGPCVTHVGKEGAGHFVKMVHNGIEYAQMQLIAESFDLLRRLSEWRLSECADAFARWNEGPRASFLMELTARVLRVKDEATGNPLVDMVVDKAGQKGTGNWTIRAALSLGVAVPTIAAAVDARTLSSLKDDRRTLSLVYPTAPVLNISSEFGAAVRDALLAAQIITWAQGMNLITAASNKFQWGVRPAEIARIWKGGCIIRSALLDDIMQAFEENTDGLLSHDTFVRMMDDSITGLRVVVSSGAARGVPLPAFSSALSYFDTCRTARLPQNLIQAQRDAFGAHTYQRTDDPTGAFHHSKW